MNYSIRSAFLHCAILTGALLAGCSEAESALKAALQENQRKRMLEDPMFQFMLTQGVEFEKRNDVAILVFSTKSDPSRVLAHFKSKMRTKDPDGIFNKYWITGFLGEAVSTKSGCGIIYAQWYEDDYPFRKKWEEMMEETAQYNNTAWSKAFAKDGKKMVFDKQSFFTEIAEACGKHI